MTEVDETRFNNLENKVAKIETKIDDYISCCEKLKDQQWKDKLDKTLGEIRGTVQNIDKRQIKTRWQWPVAFAMTYAWIGFNLLSTNQLLSYIILVISSFILIDAMVRK